MDTNESVKTKLALEIAQLVLDKAELLADNETLQAQLNQLHAVLNSDEALKELFTETKDKMEKGE